jgi:phytoene dehydrogenase-like protein
VPATAPSSGEARAYLPGEEGPLRTGSTDDTLILGSGMAALTLAALLAHAGQRVRVLEAHEHPGGYAHSFPMGPYRFCAQVHYVFGCEPGGAIATFLRRVGLDGEIRFRSLDPEGFDHVIVAGERFRIPNGFDRWCARLSERFPAAATPIRRYFSLLSSVRDELDRLPDDPGLFDWLRAPLRQPNLLQYRDATLHRVFEALGLPARVRAILAGQSGDYLLPPRQVSFLLHAALVAGYDRGAFYPERHYGHLVDTLVAFIRAHAGCAVDLEREVSRIVVRGGRVTAVHTADGATWTAGTYVSNIDPSRTLALLGDVPVPASWTRRLAYPYSCSTFTLYLGVRGLDLRDHGFGSWNTWHYPHDDLDRLYADQLERRDLSDPFLFLATPSLHSDAPGLAPPGHQVLEVATACDHAHFAALKAAGSAAYTREKIRVRDRLLDILEERYIPGLRRHLAMRVVGSATTNARYCWSPAGNAYGAALTTVSHARVPFRTPFPNLWLVNATAGWPSVCGTVRSGTRLFDLLARA